MKQSLSERGLRISGLFMIQRSRFISQENAAGGRVNDTLTSIQPRSPLVIHKHRKQTWTASSAASHKPKKTLATTPTTVSHFLNCAGRVTMVTFAPSDGCSSITWDSFTAHLWRLSSECFSFNLDCVSVCLQTTEAVAAPNVQRSAEDGKQNTAFPFLLERLTGTFCCSLWHLIKVCMSNFSLLHLFNTQILNRYSHLWGRNS